MSVKTEAWTLRIWKSDVLPGIFASCQPKCHASSEEQFGSFQISMTSGVYLEQKTTPQKCVVFGRPSKLCHKISDPCTRSLSVPHEDYLHNILSKYCNVSNRCAYPCRGGGAVQESVGTGEGLSATTLTTTTTARTRLQNAAQMYCAAKKSVFGISLRRKRRFVSIYSRHAKEAEPPIHTGRMMRHSARKNGYLLQHSAAQHCRCCTV